MSVHPKEDSIPAKGEMPKIDSSKVLRKYSQFQCINGHIWQSRATLKSICPTCKSVTSLTASSSRFSKSDAAPPPIVDPKAPKKMDFDVTFVENGKTVEPTIVDITVVAPEPVVVPTKSGVSAVFSAEPFNDLIELGNAVLKAKGMLPIEKKEVDGLVNAINEYCASKGITVTDSGAGASDIILRVVDLVLPRIINWLAARAVKKEEPVMDGAEIASSK